ncbi:unnamed protein product [Leptosia nina]|uniref:Glucose-methanol-choline oxidoreductase N-terminal domain-containing protein n=1 Tax=Leptosia nina TaxID=320188 RepID=A0AAV1IXT9_9NEOP
MASSSDLSLRPLVTSTRIMFGLLPGLGALIVLRMAIHLYRPDIEDAKHRVRDHPFDQLYDCYDFIIVGGGSAGSVLANRLSENTDWNILLLEAGQDENVLSEVPVLFPVLQTSSIDWKFVTEPSTEYCLSMIDNRCKWPRGKVLGGSSVLNAMLYVRGNKRDYDNWEKMGNTGWSYKEILKYFLKAEDMRIPEFMDDPYHSVGGPLTIENFRYEQPITRKILEAAQELGYDVLDVNGEYQTGFTRSHATIRDGLRCSSAKAYLRPASNRPNLHVSVHSLVEKVLIDENKKAYGVKFTKHGKTRIIKVSKEVILSAGSIQSPQLLMLSGIGHSDELKEVGLYPIAHLPGVGKNLQDHIALGGHSYLFNNPFTNGSDYCFNLNTVFSVGSLIDFAFHKKGQLYSMMEAEAMAFINTKYQDPLEDYPDIQLFIAPTADNMDGGLFGKRANGLTDEVYSELYEDILYESSFSIVPLLLRPKSRGFLKLRDADPYSPPLIYPNYFSEPEDILRMIEGARFVQELVQQPSLQELNARPNANRNPGCKEYDLMSDEHLECQARHHTLTIYHPVGTCAMGPDNDLQAVVDPRLKVYGVKNLRVVDGSVMPKIVSGNTNAPIIMIAEKASDMVKEDWSRTTTDSHCSTGFYKRVEQEDGKSTVNKNNSSQVIDFFNETANLFDYLSNKTNRNSTSTLKAESSTVSQQHIMTTTQRTRKHRRKSKHRPSYIPYPYILPVPYMLPYYPNEQKDYYNSYPQPHWFARYLPNQPFWPYNGMINEPNMYYSSMTGDIDPDIPTKNPYYFNDDTEISDDRYEKCRRWIYYDGFNYRVGM